MDNRATTILSCSLCIALGFVFICIGMAKLAAPGAAEQTMAHWGFPEWFPVFIGVLEVAGGVLVVFRRTTTLGAAVLGGVMLGAVATHLHAGEPIRALLPAALLVPVTIVGFWRRMDASWMRRPSRVGVATGGRNGDLRASAWSDDDSIVPGLPELRIAQDWDARESRGEPAGPRTQRSA